LPRRDRIDPLQGVYDPAEAFKEGLFQVQGEAAQICAIFCRPENDLIADMCTGLGGKSTHLAQLMKDRGSCPGIGHQSRAAEGVAAKQERLGIHRAFYPWLQMSRATAPFLRAGAIGKIMVDGPCSGLGVISKHPDTKLTKKEDDINRLAMIQKSILSQSCGVLDREGEMLYVTCTISKEENEGVVEEHIAKKQGDALLDLRQRIPEWGFDLVDDNGFFKTFPHVHGMEGFFAALFRKK
jgi:16S rRNA (cytosine967-C5)-methyltransferase